MPVITIEKCLTCGVSHKWVFESMRLKELRDVKKLTGMTVKEFAEKSDDADPDAITALVWVLHKRDKISVQFDDIDLDFSDFSMEPTEEEQRQIDELEKQMAAAELDGRESPKEATIENGPNNAAD